MNNQNKIQEEVIEVKGMNCKSCAEKIETRLLQLKGVNKVRVSLVEEKAYIQFDPTQINLDMIKAEIENIGYKTGAKNEKNKSYIKQGIFYGLIPHIGCIAFIIASLLGVTLAVQLFKPLLLNPYFFYILILISFAFATVSAFIYLKRQGFITFNKTKDLLEISFSPGVIKRKWKYLSTLYGTTIGVNLLVFMVIFPLLANISSLPLIGAFVAVAGSENANNISSIRLKVDIPCPGHALLISQELKSINGVKEVQFSFPNIFDVKYDSTKVSKQQILSLEVFNTYKATVLDESATQQLESQSGNNQSINTIASNISGSCGSEGCSCGCNRR